MMNAMPPGTEGFRLAPFTEAVRRALKANSLSLADAARRVNQAAADEGVRVSYTRNSVAHWTRGTIARPDSVRWLARALGLPVSELAEAAERQDCPGIRGLPRRSGTSSSRRRSARGSCR